MSKNSENAGSCSAAGQAKCAPIGLLLFVGFIFGFSVGFGTHDIIFKTLSKAMYSNKSVMSEPIASIQVDSDDEGEPTTDESQEEEKQPEGQPTE